MNAEDAIGARISDDFCETRRIAHRAGAPVGDERKAPRAVLDTFRSELLLGLTDPGDFGTGIDYPRHRVEVDVAVLARNALRDGNTLFFRFVRQHGSAHD